MTYERRIGERILDSIAKRQITSEYSIELEERMIYNRSYNQYQHIFSTQIYAISGKSRLRLANLEDNEHYSDDEESVAKNTLEGVVKYVKEKLPAKKELKFIGPTKEKVNNSIFKSKLVVMVS